MPRSGERKYSPLGSAASIFLVAIVSIALEIKRLYVQNDGQSLEYLVHCVKLLWAAPSIRHDRWRFFLIRVYWRRRTG